MAEKPEKGGEVTRLLVAWRRGSEEAREELWTLLYDELKSLARGQLRRGGRHRGATSLVHQAFLRLLGTEIEWQDRRHFFAVASRAMRFVLIDEARRQLTEKRRAEIESEPTPLDDPTPEVSDPMAYRPEEVIAVHEALARLAQIKARHEKLVELRYFAGLSVEETAEVLGVTTRTVVRDWRAVRLFLHEVLSGKA